MRLHSTTTMLVFVRSVTRGPLGAARLVILAFAVFEGPLFIWRFCVIYDSVSDHVDQRRSNCLDVNSVCRSPKGRNCKKKEEKKENSQFYLEGFFAVDYLDLAFLQDMWSQSLLCFFVFSHRVTWEHIHLLLSPITACWHGHTSDQRECIMETCRRFRGTETSLWVRSQSERSACPRCISQPTLLCTHCTQVLSASSKHTHSPSAAPNFHAVSQQHWVTEKVATVLL